MPSHIPPYALSTTAEWRHCSNQHVVQLKTHSILKPASLGKAGLGSAPRMKKPTFPFALEQEVFTSKHPPTPSHPTCRRRSGTRSTQERADTVRNKPVRGAKSPAQHRQRAAMAVKPPVVLCLASNSLPGARGSGGGQLNLNAKL